MESKRFSTCINCIDGRTHEPIINFIKKELRVKYVDMVTEPGPDMILAQNKERSIIAHIKRKVKLSIERNKSGAVILVGHYDCKANPISAKEHLEQIKRSVENIRKWNLGVPVCGVWIDKNFKAKRVTSIS